MIIEDTRSSVPGAFVVATKIWEMAVLPSVLNSADCWMDIPKAAMEKLDKLQNAFYQVILKCPCTCPKPGLYWYTGGILMSNRIIEKKLNFIFHATHLSKDSLAYQVLETQQKMETGLWNEILLFLRELEIEIYELEDLTKTQWKSRVWDAVLIKNRSDLLKMIEPYKKLDYNKLKNEEFKTKNYFHFLKLELLSPATRRCFQQ